jgi:NAD(P)-dependent dehydrogenase (short-subunit alcohol dehydrogenase family)
MTKTKGVALITGAGQGIGRGIALELARDGYAVAGNDIFYNPKIKKKGLFEVVKRIREMGGEIHPIAGDISNLDVHESILNEMVKTFGRIDILVNNAGAAPEKRMDVLETTSESYDRLISINARGAFFLTQKVARIMISDLAKNPSLKKYILFITSISAEVSSPTRSEYCISKAALSQTARIYADRLAEYGIRVFEIRPGIIQTDMTAPVKEKYDRLIAGGLIPQNRWGLPEDIGKAVLALIQGGFDYATGLVVEISGGMQIRRL